MRTLGVLHDGPTDLRTPGALVRSIQRSHQVALPQGPVRGTVMTRHEHRPVDINALVDESLNLAYHGARAEKQGFDITLERSFDPAAGEADLFPQEITRALLNLISNGFYAAMKRKAEANGGDYEPTLAAATKSSRRQRRNQDTRQRHRYPAGSEGFSPSCQVGGDRCLNAQAQRAPVMTAALFVQHPLEVT